MDPFDELGSLRKQNRGQSECPKCGKQYNNRSKPVKCTGLNCDAFLGGSFKPKVKEADAQLLTSTIASVRLNAAGIPVRVFVDLKENKVSRHTFTMHLDFSALREGPCAEYWGGGQTDFTTKKSQDCAQLR